MNFFSVLLVIISLISQPLLAVDNLSVPELMLASNREEAISGSLSLGMDIKAKSALVLDDQGEVIFAKNSKEISPPASLTKLMSSIIIWETLETVSPQEENSLKDRLCPIYPEKDETARQIKVYSQESAKVEDLLRASLIASINNANQSLVEFLEKNVLTEEKFIDLMNEKAKFLGMEDTYFYDTTGLNVNNQSTAEDLALLINHFYKIEELKEIIQMEDIQFPVFNGQQTRYVYLKNTNELLDSFIPVYGKTGYLEESGYCFAGKFQAKGKDFTLVLLGAPSSEERFQDIKALTWWIENRNAS